MFLLPFPGDVCPRACPKSNIRWEEGNRTKPAIGLGSQDEEDVIFDDHAPMSHATDGSVADKANFFRQLLVEEVLPVEVKVDDVELVVLLAMDSMSSNC